MTSLAKLYQNANLAATMTRDELLPWALVGMEAIESERQLTAVLESRPHPSTEPPALAPVVTMPDRTEPDDQADDQADDGNGDRPAIWCECGAGPFHHNAHLTRHTKAKHRRSPHPDELEPAADDAT